MLFAYRAISRSSTMKLAAPCLAALLITCASTVSPGAPEPDPLSVVQALMDSQSAIDPDAALALFADDAVIVNATGDKFAGDDLWRFVQADTWANDRFAMESPRVHGDKVVWTKSVTAGFYQHLGIAPVQFTFEATVLAGRITSINAHFPLREIARIEEAGLARAEEGRRRAGAVAELSRMLQCIDSQAPWHYGTRAMDATGHASSFKRVRLCACLRGNAASRVACTGRTA